MEAKICKNYPTETGQKLEVIRANFCLYPNIYIFSYSKKWTLSESKLGCTCLYIPGIAREYLQLCERELLIPRALVVVGRLLWLPSIVDEFDFQELESKNRQNKTWIKKGDFDWI